MVEVTAEDFKEYEKLRISGVVNMMDATRVMSLTNLSRDQHAEIIENYEEYCQEYPEVLDEVEQ